MAKDTVKEIPWAKVVAEIEDISGIPRKQIDEMANQMVLGVESVIEKNQPKRDGDEVTIETPLGTIGLVRFGAQNVLTPDGRQVVRPACVGANIGLGRNFIYKANIGLVDKATEEAEKKKTVKSA
jgi:hypothetical protein